MQRIMFSMMVILVLLAACGVFDQAVPTPWPGSVEWETAVEILHSGKVVSVVQLHNLSVTLQMDDGSQIETVEPVIDEIFREIELCGRPCEGITLATE